MADVESSGSVGRVLADVVRQSLSVERRQLFPANADLRGWPGFSAVSALKPADRAAFIVAAVHEAARAWQQLPLAEKEAGYRAVRPPACFGPLIAAASVSSPMSDTQLRQSFEALAKMGEHDYESTPPLKTLSRAFLRLARSCEADECLEPAGALSDLIRPVRVDRGRTTAQILQRLTAGRTAFRKTTPDEAVVEFAEGTCLPVAKAVAQRGVGVGLDGAKPTGLDRFPLQDSHPLAEEHRRLTALQPQSRIGLSPSFIRAVRDEIRSGRSDGPRLAAALFERDVHHHAALEVAPIESDVLSLISYYAVDPPEPDDPSSVPPHLAADLLTVCALMPENAGVLHHLRWVLRAALGVGRTGLPPRALAAIGDLAVDPRFNARNESPYFGVDHSEIAMLLDRLAPASERLVCGSSAWNRRLRGWAADGDGPSRTGVLEILLSGKAAKPSARWLSQVRSLMAETGFDESMLETIVGGAAESVSSATEPANNNDAQLLRGVCWAASGLSSGSVARAIGRLSAAAYKKLPGVGPRAVKVGNAAVWALGRMPSEAALAQLAYLKARVKFGTAQRLIAKALAAKAEAMGVPAEEVEELAVPACGLTGVGRREEPLGEFTAVVEAAASGKTTLTWRKPDGKTQKSVPAAVKADFAEELKDLKAANKDLAKIVPAQKERLDGLFLRRRPWAAAAWRERYADHPVVGVLARRLIWSVRDGDAVTSVMPVEGGAEDAEGRPVEVSDTAGLSLWHPLTAGQGEAAAWRARLEAAGTTQPFKQAHREVYPLTDAERATATYSNRFAAHVLKQHQFNALAQARGWKTNTRMMVDDAYAAPSRRLPEWGLRAEFWVEGVGDDYTPEYVLDSGSYRYVATDQVRFYRIEAAENYAHATGGGYGMSAGDVAVNHPLPLEEVPALALSEVMRDVDLFVGVASVGNDPQWQDGGPEGRFRDYWQDYSFGDLSATAQTRRAVLERLVPRLKIAGRCELEEKFLRVRGDVRTYRIHLGSGNILMEPNDQYLCIVPDASARKGGPSVALPFEGDRTLSLILSKAMLLAGDASITDRTILSQIRR